MIDPTPIYTNKRPFWMWLKYRVEETRGNCTMYDDTTDNKFTLPKESSLRTWE